MKGLRASNFLTWRRGTSLALLLTAAAAMTPSPALAQDTAAAEVLFVEAKDLMAKGNFAEACPKLEASFKLDKTVGTLMNTADCHEKLGKIATAWGEWGSAHDWLKRDGDKRATYAGQRRDALTPRLPKLQINVTGAASSLEVYRGPTRVDPAAYNLSLPVDPGAHTITVRRGDQVLKEERVELAEGATAATSLDLEAIEKSAPPPPPPAPTGPAEGSVTAPPPPPPLLPPPPTSYRSTGFTVGGIGVGVLAVGGILGLVALQSMSTTDDPDACIGIYCSPTGIEAIDRAKLFAEAGQWVGIGGIVMIGIGATLVLTSPSGSPPARAGAPGSSPKVLAGAEVGPWVGPSGAGVSLKGRLW